jgi:class 3 adenylate cyclase/tetratricopeptide (TPR) repeat protein
MTEREELEQAMAALDQQRTVLGDAAVEAALAGLQQRLAALDKGEPASPALAGERRVATILFCDVKGSTAMASQLDPEDWAGIMKRAMAYLIPPVTRYDGTVARLMGDAILAFFGAPTTHEDDPQRAIRAGLEIIEGIQDLRAQLQGERGLDFNVRVGLNTGLVFVGAIGADRRVEYTAMGDTINLAARMEQTAQPGSVQITEQTFKLVEPWFEFEALGGIQVKGKSEPVVTYRVLGLKARPGRGRGLESHGLAAALVGRQPELERIEACLENLQMSGAGGIVGILGEAGLGKSRLVAEAKAFAAQRPGGLWLEGQTLSFGQTISYWPFQQILRGWAGISEDDETEAAWSKLERRVRALFGDETSEYLPYLASLLSLPVLGDYAERVKYLDGEAMGKQIFLTARRFFERLARSQPTVLVFEDLHWMDESSTHLLEHLFALVQSVPLLIFGLSRPERDTPAARLRELCVSSFGGHYIEIRLAPLSAADSAQLIHNLLDIADMPTRLRETIVDKADGNPFFLEEVLRTLIDTGAVQREAASGRWRATAQIETLQIPNTIQGVIMARVDRLDEELKQVLRVASVIGRTFLYRVLKALSATGLALDEDLAQLQAVDLIHEKQPLPELEFMFKHALAQEATYASLLLQTRRQLHAAVARAMEALFAERVEEFYGLLAYHYARAEVWDKAQDYLLKAADQAGQIAADAEALNLYRQALDVYARAFGDEWDPAQRAALARKMGDAFFRRGEYTLALEQYTQALAGLGYRLPESRGAVRWALLREVLIQVGHRLRPQSEIGTAPVNPSVEDEVSIYRSASFIDAFTNAERALLLFLRMLNVSRRHQYAQGTISGCFGLAVALDSIGRLDLSRWYHRHALQVAEKIGSPAALGPAYGGLETEAHHAGRLDEALDYGLRAAQAQHETGNPLEEAFAISMLAWITIQQGRFPQALKFSRDLLRLGEDAGALTASCWGETTLGFILNRQGKLDEAVAHLQQAVKLAETVPDHIFRIYAGAELGWCYQRQGDNRRAIAVIEASLQARAQHQILDLPGHIILLCTLAETYLAMAAQAGGAQRTGWLKRAQPTLRTALREVSRFPIKAPQAMRLQGTYEWLCGKPAAAQAWWQKSLMAAERLGMRFDQGLIHLEMGQRLGAPAHLEQAAAIFADIGAELDLAQTQALLGA